MTEKMSKNEIFGLGNSYSIVFEAFLKIFREILISKEQEDTVGKVWRDGLPQLHIPSDVEQRC